MDGIVAPGARKLRVARTFAAPPERVFRAWTEPDLLRRWFHPTGGSSPSAEVDAG